eukprot:GHVS01005458.1.p3 GENE.GHVS01005458.1~~GHVS01005458.1.p3  ORF type:complete len:105 (-),score=20.12 GHVS01005458.1:262-576(-)
MCIYAHICMHIYICTMCVCFVCAAIDLPTHHHCHCDLSSPLVDSAPTTFSAFTESLLGVAAGMWLKDEDYVCLPSPKDSTLLQRRHHFDETTSQQRSATGGTRL